ncbi:MAG: hypothetical protein WBO04_17095 [Steroidobacteraceae bacterium]
MKTYRHAAIVAMLVLAASTLPVAQASASGDAAVGVVAEYRPAAGRFTLARAPGAQTVPVRIGTAVHAGDRVTLPAGAAVTVQLANGEVSRFGGPGTFAVPDARPLGRLASILKSLPALFDDEYRLAGTAASRGSDACAPGDEPAAVIEVPILGSGASIVAGRRDLPLAWRGGCKPYTLTVADGARTLARRESVEEGRVRLDGLPLTPGRYTVRIVDSRGAFYAAPLDAVATGPVPPPDLAADASPLGVVAQAVWFAEQDGGRWRLESFERLRPLIRAGDPLAGVVGDGLLWGAAAP